MHYIHLSPHQFQLFYIFVLTFVMLKQSLLRLPKLGQNGLLGRLKHPTNFHLVAIYCLSIQHPFCFSFLKVILFSH
jgi:hypothetical protein